jgi:peptide/nickel transport system substrate-binding protein
VLRTSDVAFPGAVDAAQLFQQSAAKAGIPLEMKREPDDGYWSDVWNAALLRKLLGRASGAGPDVFDRLSFDRRLERHEVLQCPSSTSCCLRRAPNWTAPSARACMPKWPRIVRDEGGLICPMFNDFVEPSATRCGLGRRSERHEMMNGRARQVLARLSGRAGCIRS